MLDFIKDLLRPLYHRLRPGRRRRHRSETSKCRPRLAPYCTGDGVDLGFGGDPIVATALRIDRPDQYGRAGSVPAQFRGDASDLRWFRDGVLDYVYSSHLLEDFADTEGVLREWWRVLKPGGRLIIFCPDEQVYRRHCAETGQHYNTHHVHADFSLAVVKAHLQRIGRHRVLHELPLVDLYSWDLVAEKL